MPRLVLSLDFELIWGVIDSKKYDVYKHYVVSVPYIVQKLLELFDKHNINATWATVGLMMCESRDEMLWRLPDIGSIFSNRRLDVKDYVLANVLPPHIDKIHYGMNLVRLIQSLSGQEIASHSFSHLNCLERANKPIDEYFIQDLEAMRNIATDRGINLKSYVFCRNQYADNYIDLVSKYGYRIYRGNAYTKNNNYTLPCKIRRRIDSYLPAASMSEKRGRTIACSNGQTIIEHPENAFFMVHNNGTLQKLHQLAIMNQMEGSFKANEDYHLWFHPWNFGKNIGLGLMSLDTILEKFNQIKHRYSAVSSSMGEIENNQ